jgi:hypothetical protein
MVGHCGAREIIWEYSVETHCERAAGSINFYFRAADIPIRYVSDVRGQRWESRFRTLNGDRFDAKVTDSRTVTQGHTGSLSLTRDRFFAQKTATFD